MKKLTIALCVVCALAVAAQAQDKEKKKAHIPKDILEKYDTNKDGKLDKDERSKMSAEDKAKLREGAGEKKKKKDN